MQAKLMCAVCINQVAVTLIMVKQNASANAGVSASSAFGNKPWSAWTGALLLLPLLHAAQQLEPLPAGAAVQLPPLPACEPLLLQPGQHCTASTAPHSKHLAAAVLLLSPPAPEGTQPEVEL